MSKVLEYDRTAERVRFRRGINAWTVLAVLMGGALVFAYALVWNDMQAVQRKQQGPAAQQERHPKK
jgi:hypothetical protein